MPSKQTRRAFRITRLFDLICSRNWLLFLVFPESQNTRVCHLDHFESHSWQITDGVTRSTESSDQYLIVFITEAHSTILGHVGSDSLVILFELNSNALTYGRVGLLSFNTDLINDDSSCMRGSSEWFLPSGDLMRCLVLLIGPSNHEKVLLANVYSERLSLRLLTS